MLNENTILDPQAAIINRALGLKTYKIVIKNQEGQVDYEAGVVAKSKEEAATIFAGSKSLSEWTRESLMQYIEEIN